MNVWKTENIINCRDMSGYKCSGGVTSGSIIRCGIPRNPSENDAALFRKLGVRTVIDLRGVQEAAERPSYFLHCNGYDYYNISLLEANPAFNKENKPLWVMYMYSLEEYSKNYAEVLRLLITCKKPAVIHCFLGKDRTGVLSALLLGIAGASREDIANDYAASFVLSKDYLEREIRENTGLIWEQDVSRLKSDKVNIESTLDMIDEKYGSIEGYMKFIGLDDDEISALSKILL